MNFKRAKQEQFELIRESTVLKDNKSGSKCDRENNNQTLISTHASKNDTGQAVLPLIQDRS